MHLKYHLLFLTIACFSAVAARGQALRHAEILGRPTDHSVTVQAFFDDPAEVCVQYGLSSGDYPSQTPWQSVPAGEPAEVLIQGLNANTRYYYRLCYRNPGATNFSTRPVGTFHTQRVQGSAFTFVVQADPH